MAARKVVRRTYFKCRGYIKNLPKLLTLLLILCLVTMTGFVRAAEDDGDGSEIPPDSLNVWNSFSGEENNVKTMLQSRSNSGEKILWAGTHYGLSRWIIDEKTKDLKSPVNYARSDGLINNVINPNSLVNDRINCMEEGESVNAFHTWLWIGTEGGISHFNSNGTAAKGDDTWETYQTGAKVRGIKKLGTVVWFATDRGVFSYNGTKWSTFTNAKYSGLPSDNIFSVGANTVSGEIWVGTGAGTAVFDGSTWSAGVVTDTVYSIFVDGSDAWFGTASGIVKLSDKQNIERFLNTEKPWVSQIFKNSDNKLSFATSQGVFIMSSPSAQPSQKSLGDSVNYILEDSLGRTWLAKENSGISEISSENISEEKSTFGLASENVNAIAWDGGDNTWFATSAGLSRHTWQMEGQSWKTFKTQDGLASNSVNDISIDAQGNLWIATEGGLNRFDGTSWITLLRGIPISSVCAVSNGDVWATVVREGVYKYDGTDWTQYVKALPENPATNVIEVSTLPFDTFTAITEGKNGTIWFASQKGIISYSASGVWEDRLTSTKDSVGTLQVNDIVSDTNGIIWAATNQGILRFDPESKSASLANPVPAPEIEPLPGEKFITEFTSISLSLEGYMVAGSTDGVYTHNGIGFSRVLNTENSIMPFNNVRTVESGRAGRLWFGFGETGGGTANITDFQSTFVVSNAPTIGTAGIIMLSTLLPLVFFLMISFKRELL